jgi:hypothetical protein
MPRIELEYEDIVDFCFCPNLAVDNEGQKKQYRKEQPSVDLDDGY